MYLVQYGTDSDGLAVTESDPRKGITKGLVDELAGSEHRRRPGENEGQTEEKPARDKKGYRPSRARSFRGNERADTLTGGSVATGLRSPTRTTHERRFIYEYESGNHA